MQTFVYNDIRFEVRQDGERWNITYTLPNGSSGVAGAGLFAGLSEGEARPRALALMKTIFPVGVKSVGPDVTHPNRIGDLKIIGPNVTHPNFVYWDKDSVSRP
ncbi:MAG: hypothetical protein ACHQ0J_14390 [Candidatus Dormibacterales bacterium]